MEMKLSVVAPVQLHLAAGQVVTLPQIDALTLEALAGAFWLTCGRHRGDHVLQPGERLCLGPARQVVLEALEPGVLRLDPRAETAPPAVPASRRRPGCDPACMRNHVAGERLAYRSMEFA